MIMAKIYTNDDKLFDTKTFKNFGHYEFWIKIRKKIFEIRKEKNLLYVNKILVYQMSQDLGNRLLTTWIFNNETISMTDLTEDEILKYDKMIYELKYDI